MRPCLRVTCPFCNPDPTRIISTTSTTVTLWDAFPVAPGHALVVTRRHIPGFFDATDLERSDLLAAIAEVRGVIDAAYQPDGYNIGVNVGEAAGQTVMHLHVHVIPRHLGDVPNPRGGVRGVIPGKADYVVERTTTPASEATAEYVAKIDPVFGGHRRPLLEPLLADLDLARDVDIAVAFVKSSGLKEIRPRLEDVLARGRKVRFLTGDYLGFTEPAALLELLDIVPDANEPGTLQVRIFETTDTIGFHPKAYLMPGHAAYVGSSNVTKQGLLGGVEWNLRIDPQLEPAGALALQREFDGLFKHERTRDLTPAWIADYLPRWRARPRSGDSAVAVAEEIVGVPEPRGLQLEALAALTLTRKADNRAGLVVMATGLGKTWLAAFDVRAFAEAHGAPVRMLFVAHRDEILQQARDTFRRVMPEATSGFFTGAEKEHAPVDLLFASIQTVARRSHLEQFAADAFDYIIVDEFHHAAASTYRRVLAHLEPKFLLGLTATPDRTDGGDLLSLCAENLVFDCDVLRGIEAEELSPFHYFGIPDDIDYAPAWRNGRFDPHAVEALVATQARAQNALEQWSRLGGTRTLAFCVSQRHADFMSQYFAAHGVTAVAVHSGPSSALRAASIERLGRGELKVLFAVDIFNEGVDIPAIDTVLMLRPTESKVVWLQQIGRGLRRHPDKDRLIIIDYIGNHRTFLRGPMALFPDAGTPKDFALLLERAAREGTVTLPHGCEFTYELGAIDILRALVRVPMSAQAVEDGYLRLKDVYGRRPSASELWHAGYDLSKVRRTHGGWFAFVRTMGDLAPDEAATLEVAGDFLLALETTAMTRAYKMVLLLAMIDLGAFPGAVGLDTLVLAYAARIRRSALLRADASVNPDDLEAVRRSLLKNPIAAWTGDKATSGAVFFAFDAQSARFRFTLDVPESVHPALGELTRELAQWRLDEKLSAVLGESGRATRIVCNVSHNTGGPILRLPDRAKVPGIPLHASVPAELAGERVTLNFVKVAINTAAREGEKPSGAVLAELLRRLLGPDVGESGRLDQVRLDWNGEAYVVVPMTSAVP